MRVLAVDLGATSVRIASVDLDARPIEPRVVWRRPNAPIRHRDGTLRWDWEGIVRTVREGLDAALAGGGVESIGVDGWGVDYGLLGPGGVISPPFSYRDGRTGGWRSVVERVGADRLYAATGVQLMGINTVFQLAVHDPGELTRADRLLLLPDLLVHCLTGYAGAERSIASTTGLLDAHTGAWRQDIAAAIGLPERLLPSVRGATERAGTYRGVPVHLVGAHDTASAFVGAPVAGSRPTAVVAAGTWVLVGVERDRPDTSAEAMAANFSNEAGALGGVRFLKNVMGLWMLERCREGWGGPPAAALADEAAAVTGDVATVDAADERFLNPSDMDREIRAASGLGASASRGRVVRCILESIAASAAAVVAELAGFVGRPVEELAVIGGGARVPLLVELYAKHTGLPVRTGSPEATALGNALVQGIALGRFAGVGDARAAAGG